MNKPIIYALDFDGVICDSAVETAITGWKAACCIWDDMPKAVPLAMIDQFRLLRPMLETGYEAILAMRLLYLEEPVEEIRSDYANKIKALLLETRINVDGLKKLFGETRDIWIANDLSDWISKNPMYDGIAAKLQTLGQLCPWYVVTTKQERFVKQILKANAIDLPDERIFGLDRNMSKVDVLTGLLKNHPMEAIHFIEDRLPTLVNVLKNEGLTNVELFFALWGYNTTEDKIMAAKETIKLLQLNDFPGF
jgi:phosphoglycolate phosphatase-like HAD superfamily hydrolase